MEELNSYRVSVVLPVYNESIDEMNKSINSILNQTYTNLELIIVNDNPLRKENVDFLNSIKDERVTILTNEKNMGIVYSLNRGIKQASSEYVARMDADDISEPDRIKKQLSEIIRRGYDLIGSYIDIINEDEEMQGLAKFPITNKFAKKAFKYLSPVVHPTWLMKKALFDSLDGYRNMFACEDYDFLLRASINGAKIGNCDVPLLRYRIRSTGISKQNSTKQFLSMKFIYKNYAKKHLISAEEMEQYLSSDKFNKNTYQYEKYKGQMKLVHSHKPLYLCLLIFNKYFWDAVGSKRLFSKLRKQ